MKILFLDVDGVLNCQRIIFEAYKVRRDYGIVDEKKDYLAMLDETMISRLNKIIEQTEAKVVISSSWRQLHPLDELIWMLEQKGFKGSVIGKTPKIGGKRGYEIEHWLDHNEGVENYVILDDNSDMLFPQMSHFVKTEFYGEDGGLQDNDVEKAIKILNDKKK